MSIQFNSCMQVQSYGVHVQEKTQSPNTINSRLENFKKNSKSNFNLNQVENFSKNFQSPVQVNWV